MKSKVVIITGGNGVGIELDIKKVRDFISEQLGDIILSSSVYRTPPFGFEAERDFLNQVLVVDTEKSPYEFLKSIWEIECLFGRDRGDDEYEKAKWEARKRGELGFASRNMDIDILFWDDFVIKTELLEIPHPEIQKRGFVLTPLKEIMPEYIHPVLKKSVSELYGELCI